MNINKILNKHGIGLYRNKNSVVVEVAEVTYDDTDSNIEYIGTWSASTNANYLNGGSRATNAANSSAKFNFTGTSFKYITKIRSDTITTMDIIIDGTSHNTLLINDSDLYQQIGYSDFSLEDKEHYAEIVFLSGNYGYVDAFTVRGILKPYSVIDAPITSKTYGVKIDTLNSSPGDALTYTDDAIGFTPSLGNNGAFTYGSWEDKFPFNAIKPCLLLNGVVNYYLNPNDYTKKIDGITASDITTGVDGDVMVEFPKIYWKFETVGTDLTIRYSDTKIDDTYKCLAHMRGTAEKDFCYISAYLGNSLASKLRSLSGLTPTTSLTIGAFRTLAQASGSGYDQMAYYQLLMLQVLYIIQFKNRDSQTALGRGNVDSSTLKNTGGSNIKGMYYGETTGKLQNKLYGIEDFYGNLRCWLDGFFNDASRNMLIANQTFNDIGTSYENYGIGASTDVSGFIDTIQGGTETGFTVKTAIGSTTTYYADCGSLTASTVPYFGGHKSDSNPSGIFCVYRAYSATSSSPYIGSRLMFL